MTTPITPLRPTPVTPNSDSYVSTSETATEPPASKAQVLEELKARIRELEGSPHYKCFICKVSPSFYAIYPVMSYKLFNNRFVLVENSSPRATFSSKFVHKTQL